MIAALVPLVVLVPLAAPSVSVTISVCTPPPQLVVVKKGFRNVPRVSLFGANVQSPANTGIETYFWDHPVTEPSVYTQTKQSLMSVTPSPNSVSAAEEIAAIVEDTDLERSTPEAVQATLPSFGNQNPTLRLPSFDAVSRPK